MIDPQQLVRAQLRPDERLLWTGTSDPSVLFSPNDTFVVPFSLLWLGFTVSTFVRADGADLGFRAFGLVFVAIGLYFAFGRFLVKRHRKRTTAYGVTDLRAIVTNGRTTRDTPVGRQDRTVRWSRDRSHCSVDWGRVGGASAFFGGAGGEIYANTGLDGVFTPSRMAFWDVADGEALVAALDRAAR